MSIIGFLMQPKPKLLEYQNLLPDPIFMSEYGNRSIDYDRT